MGTKTNPGDFDCYAAAGEDEPIFTLRANDPLAPILVDLWVDIRMQTHPAHSDQHEKEREAHECARSMRIWYAGERIANEACNQCGHARKLHSITPNILCSGEQIVNQSMPGSEPAWVSTTPCDCQVFVPRLRSIPHERS